MKKLFNFILSLALLAPVSALAQGKNTYVTSTLSAALDPAATFFNVASNTSMAPANNPIQAVGNTTNLVKKIMLVDAEMMEIQGTTGTTGVNVIRGFSGTTAAPHLSSARVWVGFPNWFAASDKLGSCTEAQQVILPMFSVNRATKEVNLYNCVGGVWRYQVLPADYAQGSLEKACTVPIGSVAYGSVGTDTTTSATAQLQAELFVPYTILATGISNLNGSVPDAASKKIVALYSISGNKIANSATAGTLASGANAFQAINFTAVALISGPARYLVVLQDDTADVAGVRTIAASTFNNVVTNSLTSVFGTLPASTTVPTTFTADVGPVACLF